MVVKNPLCKDDDTEFKKLAAVYAYAANHATPAAADTLMQRIFNMVHGEANYASVFLAICQGARPFDRLYEESSLANINCPGTTTKRILSLPFSPNRSVTPLDDGEHIQVKWLQMKSLNGDCNELVSGKVWTWFCITCM